KQYQHEYLHNSGHVVETAHLDASGTWVPDGPGDRGPYGGTGMPVGGPGAGSHPITVEVGGHRVPAEATVDSDHDGACDTAVVRTPDGSSICFTDSDGDGSADRAAVYDSQGTLVGTAHYDTASGTWIEDSGAGTAPTLAGGAAVTVTAATATTAAGGIRVQD
ncbi:MAG: hypothetical protein ACJ786_29080, partial [Catenulispora sp.]